MKKSLLALAVLGAFAGAASAQSSVTLFGVVDTGARIVKNDGTAKRLSLSTDGIASSRIGFRGIEDLGGGLKAGFWLEGGVAGDVGAAGQTSVTPNKFFNRRSTVSLISNAGELRLGRDYVPTFWNTTVFDAFGTNGIGSSTNVNRYVHVRQDNAIQYFLPSNLGGFYGQFMAAAGESAAEDGPPSSLDKGARYIGGRLGFAAGPFDVAFSVAQERYGAGAVGRLPTGTDDKQTIMNVGGAWDFGTFKLMGYVGRTKAGDAKETMGSISGLVRLGQSEIHLGYDRSKFDPSAGDNSTVWQAKATYQYNLSKRTAMYGTVSFLSNADDSSIAIPGGFAIDAGGKSKGAEFGVRHIF